MRSAARIWAGAHGGSRSAASARATTARSSLEGGAIVASGAPLVELGELSIQGPHNAENAMAAAGAALAMGLDPDAVAGGLRAFAGVPHRLERHRGGRWRQVYVNDSKATNVAAARAAILSFSEPVHAILGGSSKGERYGELADPLARHAKAAYLIGATAGDLEDELEAAWDGGVEHQRYPDLGAAFEVAADAAEPGEVVLLAPACASFDQYADYEERGDHFRSLVEALS